MLLAAISINSFNAAFAVDSSVDIKVNIEPVLSLSVTQPEAIAINANNINTLQTSDFTASAATNNITGYTLTMSSTTTDLVNNAVMVEGAYPVIPTLESNVTSTNFPENHWGMSYDNGSSYTPFTLSSGIAHTMSPGNATPINMKVGTKVNLNLGSGIYSNTVNFHLVANQSVFTITWNANGGTVSPSSSTYNYGMPLGELPVPTQSGYDFKGWFTEATGGTEVTPETVVAADATYYAHWEKQRDTRTLADITYMQDINSDICENTATATTSGGQYQLKDSRDNKLYWVAKLADGNCWMTQNLDLELSTPTALDNTNTDLNTKASWTPNRSTQDHQYKTAAGVEDSNALWDSDYNTVDHSYRPASDVAAGTSGDYGKDGDTYFSPAFMQNGTTMATWKTTKNCTDAGNSAELCVHWNVGTFYSWRAATAGSGNETVTTSGTNVTDSICPKGWKLPTSTDSGDFKNLVTKAGITASNITAAPFYFLRSGYYAGNYGAVYYTGDYGAYWSATSGGSGVAYSLYFYSGGVDPSNRNYRYRGMSVRCLAR